MKNNLPTSKWLILIAIICVIACNDDGTSTTETKTEQKSTSEKKADEKKADEKTEISVGPDGAAVKTKSGTEVKVGEKGVKVGTKDVNISVDPEKKKKDD